MVQLVLVFCLLSNKGACIEQRPMFENPLTLMGCQIVGQQMAGKFVNEHPQYRLNKVRCEMGKRPEEKSI